MDAEGKPVTLDLDAQDAAEMAEGNLEAFERIYRRHVARVRGLARWLIGNDEPDDAVQEVFLRLWLKGRLYDGRAPFGPWLGRLAINVILNWRSKHRRHQQREDGGAEHAFAMAEAPGVPGDTTEGMLDLEASVPRLPQGARDVFVLFDVQGYSHEEIAEALEISVGTSRSQLHRARTLLRQQLAPKGANP
jgi:RNA polymerase sigma-70 factor (ECF subfamily)